MRHYSVALALLALGLLNGLYSSSAEAGPCDSRFPPIGMLKTWLYQHPGKGGQELMLYVCNPPDDWVNRRKQLSREYLYPGDPSNWDTWNDKASSLEFEAYDAINLYEDHNYEGRCVSLYINAASPARRGWINLNSIGFNDVTSSYKVLYSGMPAGSYHTRCPKIPLVLKPGSSSQLIPTTSPEVIETMDRHGLVDDQ